MSSGDHKPPLLDPTMSQASDGGLSSSQPLSDETFNLLWQQIATGSIDGALTTEPISWNFQDFQGGDIIEDSQMNVELQHLEFAPNFEGLGPQFSQQTQSFQPNMFPENAVPGPALTDHTEYPTEATTTPPPTSAAAQTLPSNVDYPGEFHFEIYLGQPTSTAAKSVSWTYSPSLKKLFVDKDKACPVMFKTSSEPPPGSYIRAMPIFKKPEYIQEQVRRCPNHAGPPSEASSQHIITCSEPSAIYSEDHSTERLSVTMEYKMPQIGTEHTTYLLTFKCFLSCVGGLNRRQIQTVFTLENNGQVLGRQVIDVRVCACPGRDRKGEEKQQTDKQAKKPSKRGNNKVSQTFSVTQMGGKRKKPDEEIYYMAIKGRTKYELLMRIKESLDLMEYVTTDQKNQYKADQSQFQQQIPNMPRFNSYPSNSSQQQPQGPSPQMPPRLNNQPSFQRQVTVPTALLAARQANGLQPQGVQPQTNHIMRDHCDGPNLEVDNIVSSQEISSSQMFGNHVSPKGQRSEDLAGTGQGVIAETAGTSQANHVDLSVETWLSNLGCSQYLEIFSKRGIRRIDQLEEMNLEQDFSGIMMRHEHREKLWKAILQMRSSPLFTSTPSSMLRASSNASTASIGSLSGLSSSQAQRYQATRFTLKQTLSIKVKEEKMDS
ncbi:cellular tumor antigen p53-like isoform X1 [Asterias rubens]|uniref:cellular tumor antigen p53-like isoform X1 n=1 Tax=Asterias rubens TaxID=7604 RepID=UPI001455D5ED|nr:cellular tumor antigen p53-like isoform X1 [Asterias rubens]XP_033642576.1 cellular tumor antigen p53-like isoform X1 [Asterias rubens]XP_033642577.1 cellular tumor antigen p53-like isoform X1 [Asterias rubens]